MHMDFKRMDDRTIMIDLSPSDLLQKGFHLHDINEESKDMILDMVLSELEERHDVELGEALQIKVMIGNFGMKVVIQEVTREDMPFGFSVPPPHMIPELIKQAITGGQIPFPEPMVEDIESFDFTFKFQDFEDVIRMVSGIPSHYVQDSLSDLFVYEGKYYLTLSYSEDDMDEDEVTDAVSYLKEFAQLSKVTSHVLEEYGKQIIKDKAIEDLYVHFVNKDGIVFTPRSNSYSIFVELDGPNLTGEECIEIYVDEYRSNIQDEVYFESLSDDEDFHFSVFVNPVKKTIKGNGSRRHKQFILECVLPVYFEEKIADDDIFVE